MQDIYLSKDSKDYSKRVALLDEAFNPEFVCSFTSPKGTMQTSVYHLSNGVTLIRKEKAFCGGLFIISLQQATTEALAK